MNCWYIIFNNGWLGSSKKRTLTGVEGHVEAARKVQKSVCSIHLCYPNTLISDNTIVHPFFTKHHHGKQVAEGPFQWLEPLGPKRSCLHGINLQPKASYKVAALDLDGTIIKSDMKGKSVDGVPVWEWWRSFVPVKLNLLYNEGSAKLHSNTRPPSALTHDPCQLRDCNHLKPGCQTRRTQNMEREDSPHWSSS